MLSASRNFTALYLAFLLSLLSTLPSTYAAVDTKVANRTIERVRFSVLEPSCASSVSSDHTPKGSSLMCHIPRRPSNYARTRYIRLTSTRTSKTGTFAPGETRVQGLRIKSPRPAQVVGLWRGRLHRTSWACCITCRADDAPPD